MKKKWGEQWSEQSMGILLDSGPTLLFKQALVKAKHSRCLVLGAGGETGLIREFSDDIVGINLSREELCRIKCFNANLILCDAQCLPLKSSSVDFIVCKSTLHHLTNLRQALFEMGRVIHKESYLFLYEPGLLNFVAFLGRKFFPTEIHDPSEKPFNPTILRRELLKKFEIVNEAYFFLFVHVIPILGKRLKGFRNPRLTLAVAKVDALLCKTYLKNLCWLMIFNLRNR